MARIGLPEAPVDSPRLAAGDPPVGFAEITIGRVFPSPTNPRKHFDEGKLEELAATIRDHGIVQPLVVRPLGGTGGLKFEIVAGERRWRAAHFARLTAVPCVVKLLDDDQVLDIQTIENLQREDLSPLEEATGYQALLDRGTYDVQAIAAKVGKTASYVYGRLKLLQLVDEARTELENPDSKFTLAHATIVSRLPRKEDQVACLKHVQQHWQPVSPAALRTFIAETLLRILGDAPFALDDGSLLADAPACLSCSKRTGAQAGLFVDIAGEKDRCLDTDCYGRKVRQLVERKRAALEKKHGQPAPLLSADYSRQKGMVLRQDYEEVNRGTPGAVQAVIANGPAAGQAQWVLLREKPTSQGKDDAAAEREAQQAKAKAGRDLTALQSSKLIAALIDQDLTQNVPLRAELLSSTGGYGEDERLFFTRHCPDVPAKMSQAERQELYLKLSSGKDFLELLLELHLLGLSNPGGYQDNGTLIDVAKAAGLDVDALTAEAKAELKAAAKEQPPTKKAAKKKAAKK